MQLTKLTINIPSDLHKRLKVAAARKGTTVKQLLVDAAIELLKLKATA